MNYKIFLIILTTLLLIISFESEAKCRRGAKVKYQTQNGWSKLYTVETIFLTGYELNTATNSINYSAYSVYAVIFWDQDEASVIKLSTILLCGSEV